MRGSNVVGRPALLIPKRVVLDSSLAGSGVSGHEPGFLSSVAFRFVLATAIPR